jgi:hypothetical protein
MKLTWTPVLHSLTDQSTSPNTWITLTDFQCRIFFFHSLTQPTWTQLKKNFLFSLHGYTGPFVQSEETEPSPLDSDWRVGFITDKTNSFRTVDVFETAD